MPLNDYIGVAARPAPIRAAAHAGDDYGATAQPDWRSIQWREKLRQVDIRGRRVNYVDMGEPGGGHPDVIFIHGLGGCWQNWLENIPHLAQTRRVLALDLPGFGASQMPAEKITISNYARTVVEFADAVGLEGPFVPVGNSMGGFVAAELGINHADRLHEIVLVAAAGISITNLRRRPLLTSARITAAVTNIALARSEALAKRPRSRHLLLSFVLRHPTRIKPDLAHQLMQGAGRPGFIPALDALTDYDFRDRLPDIKNRTLLVWGRCDNLVPVEDADEFERLIPDSRKIILEDTGHVPMIERPETFNDLLIEFLDEAPARSSAGRLSAPLSSS